MRLREFYCRIVPSGRGIYNELELSMRAIVDRHSQRKEPGAPAAANTVEYRDFRYFQSTEFEGALPLALEEMSLHFLAWMKDWKKRND